MFLVGGDHGHTPRILSRPWLTCGCPGSDHLTRSPLTIDLSAITYIGAAGINELLRAATLTEERGSKCLLRSPSPMLVRIVEACGLGHRLQFQTMPVGT